MDSKTFGLSFGLVLYVILSVFKASAHAYFAWFLHNEARPYFQAHDMEGEAYLAKCAEGFLITCALFTALNSTCQSIRMVIILVHENSFAKASTATFFAWQLSFMTRMIVLTIAVPAAVSSWDWWQYFAGEGLEHLAKNCQGLVVVESLIAAITSCYLIFTLVSLVLPKRVQSGVNSQV